MIKTTELGHFDVDPRQMADNMDVRAHKLKDNKKITVIKH